MRNPIRLGNKAALIVGMLFFVADSFPLFHEFGAWSIGCLFCFYYSASAIAEEQRASKKMKYSLYAILFVLLLVALSFHESDDQQSFKRGWSFPPALKAMGFEKK